MSKEYRIVDFDEAVSPKWGCGAIQVSADDLARVYDGKAFLYFDDGEYAHAIQLDGTPEVKWKK